MAPSLNARGLGIADVAVKGEDITFSIWHGSVRHHYRGKVKGGAMGGMVNLDGREATLAGCAHPPHKISFKNKY